MVADFGVHSVCQAFSEGEWQAPSGGVHDGCLEYLLVLSICRHQEYSVGEAIGEGAFGVVYAGTLSTEQESLPQHDSLSLPLFGQAVFLAGMCSPQDGDAGAVEYSKISLCYFMRRLLLGLSLATHGRQL